VSFLTQFLKAFDLYKPPMSTARRLRTATELIESGPRVGVYVVWAAYGRDSNSSSRNTLRYMRNFPRRADGTYDPVVIEGGEVIRARAYVTHCWPLDLSPASPTQPENVANISGVCVSKDGKYVSNRNNH